MKEKETDTREDELQTYVNQFWHLQQLQNEGMNMLDAIDKVWQDILTLSRRYADERERRDLSHK